jgi:serine/threonine protein kinase/tetratricopeptide (TPR) repeat protein
MNANVDTDAVVQLAEDFVARYRRGEKPELQEYVKQYPELADEVASLVEALLFIEKLGNNGSSSRHRLKSDHPAEFGEYRILGEIGRGGMGVVYEAVQASLNRPVALKVLPKASTTNTVMKQRFLREARTAAALHHSHIVPVHGVGEHDGACYFVMQKIDGIALDRIIHHLKNSTRTAPSTAHGRMNDSTMPPDAQPKKLDSARSHPRPMTVQQLVHHWETMTLATRCREAARIGAAIADALSYAHEQGVLHRDVKPGNILIDHQQQPWLNDFGLAQVNDANDLTATGQVVGTLRYLPPERLKGVSSAVGDIYSLGITLYELIALQNPFPSTDQAQLVRQISTTEPPTLLRLNPAIPIDLNTIVMKCLEKEPDKRYASAGSLATDLQRYLHDEAISARSPSLLYRLSKLARRHRGAVIAAALILLTLIAGVIGTSVGMFKAQKALEEVKLERDQKIAAFVKLEKEQDATQAALQLEKVTRRQAIDALRQQTDALMNAQLQRRVTLTDEERAYFLRMIEIYQSFTALRADDEESKALQAEGLFRIGNMQRALGDLKASMTTLDQSEQMYRDLLTQSPQLKYCIQLASTYFMKGNAQLEGGQAAKAANAFEQGLAVLDHEPLAEAANAQVTRERIMLLQGLGNALIKTTGYEPAYTAYRKAEEYCVQYRRSKPDDLEGRHLEASLQANLAMALAGLKKDAASQQTYHKALSLRKDLITLQPRHPDHQIALANMQSNYAVHLSDLKQFQQAIKVHGEALNARQQLAHAYPAVLGFQMDIANSHELIASNYTQMRDFEKARQHHVEAARIRLPLATQYPQLQSNILILGGIYCNQGNMERLLQRHEAAFESYRLAIQHLESVLQTIDQQERTRLFLHNSYMGRARTWMDKKDYASAIPAWNKAIEYYAEPIMPHYRRLLCMAYVNPAEVINAANRLPQKDLNQNPSQYELASCYAVAAGVTSNAELSDKLAGIAMTTLRKLGDNGYLKDAKRLERFKNNPVFKPLHSRDDYRQWLATLSAS